MLNSVEPHVTRPSEDEGFVVGHRVLLGVSCHIYVHDGLPGSTLSAWINWRKTGGFLNVTVFTDTCIVTGGDKYCSVKG